MNDIEYQTKLDPLRQEKAKEFSRIQRRLLFIELAIGGAYMIFWMATGLSQEYKSWLLNFTTSEWLVVPAFAVGFGGIYSYFNLPISYYGGFILPHRFGLSNQSLQEWIFDQIRLGLIGGTLGLVVLELIYVVLRTYPETWWIWAAGILLIVNVLLANLAPILLFPIFYKFKPLGEEYANLEIRLITLAKQAGTDARRIFQFDMSKRTNAANAALTGLGNTRRIILGDTLLNEFEDDEIEVVLAHELGHHVHNDIPLNLILGTVSTLVGLYLAALALNWGIKIFGYSGVGDISALPLFGLVIGVFGLATMPLNNTFSRWRERLADEYAIIATNNPQAFASAMTRLANQNLAEAEPDPWIEWLLHSHPALEKRIAMAKGFEGKDETDRFA